MARQRHLQLQQEESIYALLDQSSPERRSAVRYRSQYPADMPPTASTFGAPNFAGKLKHPPNAFAVRATAPPKALLGPTLGPKSPQRPDPNAFLRKHTMLELDEPKKFTYTIPTGTLKPKIDMFANSTQASRDDAAPESPEKRQPNFITQNAIAAITAKPRKIQKNQFDYTHKEDYGKVPAYLASVKDNIEREKAYVREVLAKHQNESQKDEPRLEELPEEERLRMLEELKEKWEEANRNYQNHTHLVVLDTAGRLRRKEYYEQQLNFLEKIN